MTLLRSLLGVLAVTLVLLSCKKERSDEDGKVPGIIETTWEFTETGQLFNGDMDSAYFQSSAGFSALTMIGSRPLNQSGELILQIIGSDISTGTYSNTEIFFQYSEAGNILYQTIPGQTGNFSITITEIDSTHVSGTFSGTAYDPSGGVHDIENGAFAVEITEGFTPGPPPDAQLTVWSKEICFDGSSIEVKVADQIGFISDAIASDPGCGAQGAATFTLPQGIYTVTAICGADTLEYDVNLSTGCVKLLVDFTHPPVIEDYLPLTQGSYWDYRDQGNAALTQRTTSVGDTVIDGRLYTMFTNGLPDTAYYRKNEHVYYEYITLDFNGSVQAPPSLEVEILHDDYLTGATWETFPIDLVLSSIPVKAKLFSKISQRDFSATIEGITYDNLIEVRTSLLFSADNGDSYVDSGSEIITVFAKGKGIVYYYEPDRATEWGAYDVSIVP